MIKYTTAFVDKLEDILSESGYTVRYERGNFQSGWCLLDHKRIVVLNKFLNTEGRVNTLVDLIPQLKINFDKLTLNSQKIYDFLTRNQVQVAGDKEAEEGKGAVSETITTEAEDTGAQAVEDTNTADDTAAEIPLNAAEAKEDDEESDQTATGEA